MLDPLTSEMIQKIHEHLDKHCSKMVGVCWIGDENGKPHHYNSESVECQRCELHKIRTYLDWVELS